MDLGPLISAFVLIFVAELGDKTMFTVITLSSKYARVAIMVGALAAFALVSALGVIIGEVLFQFISQFWLQMGAAALFLLVGIYTLVTREREAERNLKVEGLGGGITAFSLVALMELGDKSQLAIIALAAESGDGGMVFIGTMMAFAIITTLMVLIGDQIGRKVSDRNIKLGSGVIFIVFGMILLIQALLF